MSPPTHPLTTEVGHYENFPVASWLCPPAIRPAVVAIYHFARTADDLADEGDAPPGQRLEALARYRAELDRSLGADNMATEDLRWPQVWTPLARQVATHRLPVTLLHDLLDAFEQDVRHTAARHRYADQAELLAYCRLSANPIGRLLLHLYGISDAQALAESDAVCSALQLINFWQDISRDHARARYYLPGDLLNRYGLAVEDFSAGAGPEVQARCRQVVAHCCHEARTLMRQGAPLVHRIPGRAGWELRLVVQGGLRTLDKIAAIGFRTWIQRPALGSSDLPLLLWRAVAMGFRRSAPGPATKS